MCIDQYKWVQINGNLRRIDSCIANIVRGLMISGAEPIASCCGHFNRWGSIILNDGRELLIVPDYDTARAFDKVHGRPIHDDRRALKVEVAAPVSGVGPNGPSLTPTASAPDCLVGEPVVDATTANKPQPESVTPCEGCNLQYRCPKLENKPCIYTESLRSA